MKPLGYSALALALLLPAATAAADARSDYYRRAADNDVAAFRALDTNGDGTLTRPETAGDLDLGPRFDDMDINRDGAVTQEELIRYVEQRYQVKLTAR